MPTRNPRAELINLASFSRNLPVDLGIASLYDCYMTNTSTDTSTIFPNRLAEIISDISLPENFSIIVAKDREIPNNLGRWYFQIRCWRRDVITNDYGYGYGGKAYLSEHMTESELVQVVFGLYKGYVEHEARETFQYQGYRVFGPHISVQALKTVARKVDVRSAQHVEDQR